MTSLMVRFYRALLHLYPATHRDRLGDDMVDCFEDLLEEGRARSGSVGILTVLVRTLVEVPRSVVVAHRESKREWERGGQSMDSVWQDIRFAVRGLGKSPGFTLLAVLSLGLGVGANTSMFSLVSATLWTPLSVPDAHELVRIKEVRETATEVSYGNYTDVVAEVDVIEDALLHTGASFALVSDEISQVIHGELVTANYFEVLEVDAAEGRFFSAAQHESPDAPLVAVISHYLWVGAFGSDPGVVGRTVMLNRRPVTILGVAPESFHGTKFGLSGDVWVPVRAWRRLDGWTPGWEQLRNSRSLLMLARLAPDATIESTNAALATVAARLEQEYPEANANFGLRAYPEVAGQIAPNQTSLPNLIGLIAILGSGLVLLVACGNVASLLLARAVARRQEIGVRVALGAGRARLVRQLLTESLILAGLGALVGTGIASWVGRLNGYLLPDIPYRFSLDTSATAGTVFFATAVSAAAILVFGLAPALQASRPGIAGVLRGDEGSDGVRFAGSRLLNGVVVGVVSLSFVTLFLAGLFAASLQHVRTLDPGFVQEGRMAATVDLALAGYSPPEATLIRTELSAAILARPEVSRVAWASAIPLGDFSSSSRLFADDREYAPDAPGTSAWAASVSPEWFDVSETALLEGRAFTPTDDRSAPAVVIVNEALARTFWPDGDVIGRRIRFSRDSDGDSYEVVGVVETGKYRSMIEPPMPAYFRPLQQSRRSISVLLAETSGDHAQLAAPLREAARAVDPSIVLYDVKTIERHWSNAFWLFRLGAQIGLVIGLLAAALSAGGLYGIMVFRVGQRRREMGIRVALGAGRSRVLRHVMRGSLTLVGWGLAIGGAAAMAVSGVMRSVVFGVEPADPTYLLGVGAFLTATAVLATLAPALGATRANPVEAIKTE